MARYWSENYLRLSDPVRDVNSPIGRILARKVYFVEVCSFKFEFHSIDRIKEVLSYFEKKTHPSSRLPDKEWIDSVARINPRNVRRRIGDIIRCERFEAQRWYERLPMWLYEEPKRQKIVKVLKQAIDHFAKQQRKPDKNWRKRE